MFPRRWWTISRSGLGQSRIKMSDSFSVQAGRAREKSPEGFGKKSFTKHKNHFCADDLAAGGEGFDPRLLHFRSLFGGESPVLAETAAHSFPRSAQPGDAAVQAYQRGGSLRGGRLLQQSFVETPVGGPGKFRLERQRLAHDFGAGQYSG